MKNAQISKLAKDQRGLSTMEYAVLFVIIIVGAIALWGQLGKSLATKLTNGTKTWEANLGDGSGSNNGSGTSTP